MIHEFAIDNYKSLKINENISLSPLTILTGVNNVGKTTFIKSILELGKNNNSFFNSNPILSDYKTKVLNNDVTNDMVFNIHLDIEENYSIKITINFKYDENIDGAFISMCEIITNKNGNKYLLRISKSEVVKPYKIYSDLGLNLLFGTIKSDVKLPSIFEGYGDFEFIGLLPIQCQLKFDENQNLDSWFINEEKNISLSVKSSDVFLESIFKVKYIGPLRNSPEQYYIVNKKETSIGSRGEHTFNILKYNKNKKISFYKKLEDTTLEKTTLLDATKFWLNYFYEGTEFVIDPIGDNNDIIRVLINGYTIDNSGFGFSQLIPIIVQSLLLNEYDLLLLEQPEIHLHPELEYKLAYFLLCIVKNKRQIIAETHSEHIINKIILSKLDNDFVNELFKVYFLEKTENSFTDFNEIEISEFGEVKNWPKGFFDQYLIFTKELMKKRKEIAIKNIELSRK